MSDDRPPRPRPGSGRPGGRSTSSSRSSNGGTGKPGSAGTPRSGGKPGSTGRPRPGGKPGSAGKPRSGGKPGSTGRPRSGGKPGGSSRGSSGGSSGGRRRPGDRVEREPRALTAAERRSAEVRATRGPRVPKSPEVERTQIEARVVDEWIDEGSVREIAADATRRASSGRRDRGAGAIDPAVTAEIHSAAVDQRRAERLAERLAAAAGALDRDRYDEARRIVNPLVRELPTVAAVHEVHGLANYRLGNWRAGAQSLELARQLRPDPALLPVLADCYRGMRRWRDVDDVWRQVRESSPSHDVMAEARIVVAGSLADRGDLSGAIKLMQPASAVPKKVRDHHLRQWYVLADLLDRAGDTVGAARMFRQVQSYDADFADVRERLRALGR